MSLEERLNEDMKAALKAGDQARLSVLRMLRSEILLEKKKDASIQILPDDRVVRAFAAYAKKLRSAADEFESKARPVEAGQLRDEVGIVDQYLPTAMAPEEARALVGAIISELGASSLKDMGRVMKEAQTRAAGRADGKLLSDLVRAALS
ncbi:MAG TPA: GatB/YqeY domain-containing protein [Candidatus Eisenbacteria bacterium]